MPVFIAIILAPIATVAAVVAAMSPIAYAVAVAVVGVALFATSSSSPTAYITDTGPIVDSIATPIGATAVRADRVVRIGGLSVRIAAPVWSTDAAPADDVAIARSALLRELAHLEACIARARRSRHRTRCSQYLGRYATASAKLDALR